jgi:hypothetical protein
VPLGHFHKCFGDKIPNTYCFSSNVLNVKEVQIKSQGMSLAIVNCF